MEVPEIRWQDVEQVSAACMAGEVQPDEAQEDGTTAIMAAAQEGHEVRGALGACRRLLCMTMCLSQTLSVNAGLPAVTQSSFCLMWTLL